MTENELEDLLTPTSPSINGGIWHVFDSRCELPSSGLIVLKLIQTALLSMNPVRSPEAARINFRAI